VSFSGEVVSFGEFLVRFGKGRMAVVKSPISISQNHKKTGPEFRKLFAGCLKAVDEATRNGPLHSTLLAFAAIG
jgi:hypothetical protein